MQPRMREDERRIIADHITGVEKIEIEGAWRILLPHSSPAKLNLNGCEMQVKLLRRAGSLDLDRRIQKRLRARRAIDGLGFINTAAGHQVAVWHAPQDQIQATPQVRRAVPHVGTEGDAEGKRAMV